MWPFRTKSPEPAQPKRVLDRLIELETLVSDLQNEQVKLHTRLQKLAGAYYARFGKGEPSDSPPDLQNVSKAELRRQLGLVPGRPTPKI